MNKQKKRIKILKEFFSPKSIVHIIVVVILMPFSAWVFRDYYVSEIQPKWFPKIAEIKNLPKPEVAGMSTCVYLICDSFQDFTDWDGVSRFDNLGDRTLGYLATNVGSILTQKDLVFLPTTILFNFTPKGDQSNVFLRYADFDVIFGDAGYTRIAVKDKTGYVGPIGYSGGHYNLKEAFQKDTLIKSLLDIQGIPGTNKIRIKIHLSYFNAAGKEKDQNLPDFIVTSSADPAQIQSQISIGLLPPSSKDLNVQVQLNSLTVVEGVKQ